MNFLRQVQLILWKNWVLRKRQKIRCLVELVWPLILFSILMWVRTRGLKSYIHECHFEEKAMPSAGQFPFLQSFICTLNNTCHRTVQQRRGEDLQNLNTTLFEKLFDEFESILGQNVGAKEKISLETATQDVMDLASLVQTIAAKERPVEGFIAVESFLDDPREFKSMLRREKLNLSESVIDSIISAKIVPQNISLGQLAAVQNDPRALLCDAATLSTILVWGPIKASPQDVSREICSLPMSNVTFIARSLGQNVKAQKFLDELWKFTELNLGRELSWSDWRQLGQLSSRLAENIRKLDSFQETLNEVGTVGRKYMPTEKLIAESTNSRIANFSKLSPSVLTSVAIVQNMLCGPDTTSILDQIAAGGGESTRFDELKDQLKDSETHFDDYVNDTDASAECNNFFKTLERNSLSRFMWNQVKPFIRGKILYAPAEPAFDRVMTRVNESFAIIERLYEAASLLSTTVMPRLKDSLINQTVSLQVIRDSWPRIYSALKANLNENLVGELENLNEMALRFLDQNNTELREAALNTLEELQVNVTILLECFDANKIESYATEEEAVKRGMELLEHNKLWAVVSFLDVSESNGTLDKLPPYVTYKIRTDSGRIDTTKRVEDVLRRPGPRRRPGIDLKYITYGFAYLQDMIDSSLIKEQTNRSRTPGIFLQQFPYPCHIIDRFILAISRTFPLFMTLSWVYTSSMIVKSIVYEKERRLKETMRVMGLGNGVHWVGWFVDSFTPMVITTFFLTLILVYGKVLENSDPSLIFVFLLIYGIATISKCFLISTFFSKANLAAAAGGIIFFVMYLPYSFTVLWEEKMSGVVKGLVCLISNVAFGYGCSYLSFFEETGIGAHWHNYNKSPLLNDALNLQACMHLLVVDAVIYAVLTWYIEAVFPGEYGVPKPWYFFVKKSYWCGKDVPVDSGPIPAEDELFDKKETENFEEEPNGLQVGVALKNLSKTYNNGKVALNNLNLNFYQNQITAFLGHNGAGKTTTISILTGLFPPSKGTANVNGYDIRTDMDSIRGSLGTCPQHNVLFDQLTVEEHLWFYARIKGRESSEVTTETEKMILDLGLPHKKHEMSKNLSGGMQRKLSIAVAFVGGSKTVILDEPTSGVDPFSRRSIWELLVKYKQNRTVILTTHFMDEADLLADRIAIISGGNLQCCGSSLFLKARFGSGFYLTVERISCMEEKANREAQQNGTQNNGSQPDSDLATSEQIKKITETVKMSIPSAELLEAVGQELVYSLPFTMAQRQGALPTLQSLLDILDKQGESVGINSYGISDTSLEEIFLKIAHDGEYSESERFMNGKKLNGSAPVNNGGSENIQVPPLKNGATVKQTSKGKRRNIYIQANGNKVQYTRASTEDPSNLENGDTDSFDSDYWDTKSGRRKLRWRQFMALQTKRFHHTRRNPKALFCEIVLPAVFVCLAFVFTMILPGLQEEPPLELHPWMYTEPNNMFLEVQSPDNIWTQRYKNQILGPYGIGTRCVGESTYNCVAPSEIFAEPLENISQISPSCSCQRGTQTCPAGAGGPRPQKIKAATGDLFHDLTGRNVSDWLVKTEDDFYKIRYGGFSLGVYNPTNRINISNVLDRISRLDRASNLGQNRFDDYKTVTENLTERIKQEDIFDNIKVWFNNKGWPMSVSYMNAINNVVLRASLPENENPKLYGIKAINHPMNFTPTQLSQEMIKQSSISLLHAIAVIFAMSFVPASFVVTLIEERASKAKHLQFVSGVDAAVYWIAAFFWDMMSYLVSATLCVFIFLIFDEKAYVSSENLPGLILLLVFYGWSSIPLMYPASFMAKVSSTAFVFLACWNLFVGIVTTVAVFVLEIFDDEELQFIGSILKEVFLIFPHFCLGQGLMKMATNHLAAQTFATFGLELRKNRFEWEFLGKNLFAMLIEGFIFFAITLAIEFGFFDPVWQWILVKLNRAPKLSENMLSDIYDDEEDVGAERQRVKLSSSDEHVLAINDLSKIYKPRGRPAVNKLCFGVKRAECFGLLGLNGAGKTSTFKMLTGDTKPSLGDAFVCGHSIQTEIRLVRRKLGYCPQFDALDPLLTAREHLELYCKLRGVPSQQLPQAVDEGLSRLGLIQYADKCAGTYSGGNKRKLSTAIALVGNPPLVFLDEPTSGMDPAARRFLWRCILRAVREGRSVVLTSHSMEECQALCSRLTVMVNGKLSCLGSAQHLKSKFGNGYTLVVRCPVGSTGAMEQHMKQMLPEAVLSESHHTRLVFQLPTGSHKLSSALGALEVARTNNFLYDYSLSQTTLEEVFLRFANKQNDLVESSDKAVIDCSCFKRLISQKCKFMH
ncbi:ATP-binding cassette sub-family A member 7-like isoform X2 [Neocloeon triangulifer]|uniref:ATP-binding cassette sub-family A member 7-like isoform X2 n=1 Tax=Neocloeon triangulifer TaxID=2078957 RepID=UPI00286EBD87|nr:ATP-binding cassette sub-family A member 7-like isoform X2 [Neocloeon triangulifer]